MVCGIAILTQSVGLQGFTCHVSLKSTQKRTTLAQHTKCDVLYGLDMITRGPNMVTTSCEPWTHGLMDTSSVVPREVRSDTPRIPNYG